MTYLDYKRERRQLSSRYRDTNVLMYPGVSVLNWLKIGAVWHLVSIEAENPDSGARPRNPSP